MCARLACSKGRGKGSRAGPHLVLVPGARHRRAPLEVARDAAGLEPVAHPRRRHLRHAGTAGTFACTCPRPTLRPAAAQAQQQEVATRRARDTAASCPTLARRVRSPPPRSPRLYLHAVGAPAAQRTGRVLVLLQLRRQLGQVQEQVAGGPARAGASACSGTTCSAALGALGGGRRKVARQTRGAGGWWRLT